MSPLSDSTTDAVIGVPRVRIALRPYSEGARRSQGAMEVYRGPDRDAWEAMIERCVATEDWWSGVDPGGPRHALEQLPTLERPLRLLESDEVLDDVALFEVKRFLYWATRLVTEVDGALDWIPAEWETRLRETMAAIHPEREASTRFHLSTQLDERLGPARDRLKAARNQARARRRELEQAIVADHGGRFDVRGRYIPEEDVDSDARLRRTRGEFYELSDEKLHQLGVDVEDASDEVDAIEAEVRARLSDHLRGDRQWLVRVRDALTELDRCLARVELRQRWEGTWGEWTDDGTTLVEEGRLPRFMDTLTPDEIQPISVEITAGPTVVTGPNMGGKSALLELVAICQWCAQHALPIPAATFRFTPVESLIYVGAEEPGGEAGTGLSAFGREVRRVVDGRSTAGPRLWLLDEFGRGTHPEEGAAIARRLIDALEDEGDRVLFATHFPSLAALDDVVHLRIAGLTDPDRLREHPEALDDIESLLRSAMDFRPRLHDPDEEAVPRDARLVAEVLGLEL